MYKVDVNNLNEINLNEINLSEINLNEINLNEINLNEINLNEIDLLLNNLNEYKNTCVDIKKKYKNLKIQNKNLNKLIKQIKVISSKINKKEKKKRKILRKTEILENIIKYKNKNKNYNLKILNYKIDYYKKKNLFKLILKTTKIIIKKIILKLKFFIIMFI